MLTAAGVTFSPSAASAKLSRVATASNTRRALSGKRSKLRETLVFLMRRSGIVFAAQTPKAKTPSHELHRSHPMNANRLVALLAAAALTAAELLSLDYYTVRLGAQHTSQATVVAMITRR